MEVWKVSQGSAESRLVPIVDADGDPIAYDGTEQLDGQLWAGNDRAPLLTFTPAWSTPGVGTTVVSLTEAQTAGLATGQYRIRCTVTGLAGTAAYYEAVVMITASPGAALARPTYCDITDLRKVDASIEQAQDPEMQVFGFADQCADAREWFDECCLRNYRGDTMSPLGMHQVALDAWYNGGRRSSRTNIWLRDRLADNCLILTGRIKRINALYACYLIYQAIRSRGREYPALAAQFQAEAYRLLVCTVAEINLNGDGTTPSIAINFSSTNTLFS